MRFFFALFSGSLLILASARLRAGQHLPKGPANLPDQLLKRVWSESSYVPANATNVQSFVTPTNVTIRYKEPGKHGVCETTEGVNSYSGYVDLDDDTHIFFWFFESRRDPQNDPITLAMNGGPGGDSLVGLFEEHGPCRIMKQGDNYVSVLNPNSWSTVSNMLYVSQPVGVGFSYQTSGIGSRANASAGGTNTFLNASQASDGNQKVTGRWPLLLPTEQGTISSSDLAARAAWHVLQGFLSGLNTLAHNLGEPSDKVFNLATESYGGHYGPSFYKYFYEQNQDIASGKSKGIPLNFNALIIINGMIDYRTQARYFPEFAVNNTYGIKAYNDTVYNYAMFANSMPYGCQHQIQICQAAAAVIQDGVEGNDSRGSVTITQAALDVFPAASFCSEAQYMCEDNVEGPYFYFGGRGVYDIRHPYNDPTPPDAITLYLNQAEVQQAMGVNLNWTSDNFEIYWAFHSRGDGILTNFKPYLEEVLDYGVRVALFYGDADYKCNWFGGEAVSLAMNYSHAEQFHAAGYQPFLVDNYEYGSTREYGNFSFTRIYEAGHEIPYYQPLASLEFFNRTISLLDIPNGTKFITENLTSDGPANATKTYPAATFPAAEATSGYPAATFPAGEAASAFQAYSSSLAAYYDSLFKQTVPPQASASP